MLTLNPEYWRYYQAIEADLENCSRYVEFAKPNLQSYSIEFAKLIVVAGAELDEVLKALCHQTEPGSNTSNINAYRRAALLAHHFMAEMSLSVRETDIKLFPWKSWADGQTPVWWKVGYNKLKHERLAHFHAASLETALHVVGALYLTILHFHHQRVDPRTMRTLGNGSKLFYPHPSSNDLQCKYYFANDPYYPLLDS